MLRRLLSYIRPKTEVISREQLKTVLEGVDRATKVVLTTRTQVRGHRDVEKVSVVRGRLNANYQAEVRRKTGDKDFVEGARAWGTRKKAIIHHKNGDYVSFIRDSVISTQCFRGASPVAEPNSAANRPSKPVQVRNYKLSSIRGIRLGNREYVVG